METFADECEMMVRIGQSDNWKHVYTVKMMPLVGGGSPGAFVAV